MIPYTIFTKYATELSEYITSKLDNISDERLKILLDAYNQWQEDEHDGVDCIFDIDDSNDLSYCISGGLTAKEIADMVAHGVKYFLFGCNYQSYKNVVTDDIINYCKFHMKEIVAAALMNASNGIYGMMVNEFFLKELTSDDFAYTNIIQGDY